MNYKIGHLIVICVALLLCVACGEQRNAVAVVYKEHFPIDTMLPIKTYPAEELVRPARMNRINNRVIAFGGYEEVGIYDYPDLKIHKENGASRSFFLFLKEKIVCILNREEKWMPIP